MSLQEIRSRRPAVRRGLAVLVLGALVWTGVAGCGGDSSTGPGDNEGSELIGTWSVASFQADGMDGIAMGMLMNITFLAAVPRTDSPAARRGVQGTFGFSVVNDQLGLCESTSDCSDENPFEVEDGVIYLERGTEDEVALSYNVSGSTLTMNGSIDGTVVQITAVRG